MFCLHLQNIICKKHPHATSWPVKVQTVSSQPTHASSDITTPGSRHQARAATQCVSEVAFRRSRFRGRASESRFRGHASEVALQRSRFRGRADAFLIPDMLDFPRSLGFQYTRCQARRRRNRRAVCVGVGVRYVHAIQICHTVHQCCALKPDAILATKLRLSFLPLVPAPVAERAIVALCAFADRHTVRNTNSMVRRITPHHTINAAGAYKVVRVRVCCGCGHTRRFEYGVSLHQRRTCCKIQRSENAEDYSINGENALFSTRIVVFYKGSLTIRYVWLW